MGNLIERARTLPQGVGLLLQLEAMIYSMAHPIPEREVALFHSDAELALRHYGNAILRTAYTYLRNQDDAEDVVQDTLVQLLRTNPGFESPEHEKAWLLRVAINLSKNKLRQRQRIDEKELDETFPGTEPGDDLSFVWDAVAALPEKYREVIHLFYHEGYSTAEIAKLLGKNESTVRTLLRRGREQLRTTLKGAYDFDDPV